MSNVIDFEAARKRLARKKAAETYKLLVRAKLLRW